MISNSLYETYKKDTQGFCYWLTNEYIALFVSNQRNSGQTQQIPQFDFRQAPKVNDFVPLATYIASQNLPVPYHVFSSLTSAIHKRRIATASYTAQAGAPVNPDQTASDASHSHFTDVLTQCRTILGGDSWVPNGTQAEAEPSIEQVQEELSSRFKALNVQDVDASSEEEEQGSSSRPRQQRKGKGKGKKKGKSNKAKAKQATREPVYKEISMESLRNIGGQDAMTMNYLIAVHSAAQQWIELRHYIQIMWQKVAYEDVNSAVAAATSKVAVSMVQSTNAAIFADFPGNDSYLSIVNALARGDINDAQGTFQVEISNASGRGARTRVISDVKEQFLYNTYLALKEFLDDFRLNRTGRPTNRLRRALASWNPTAVLADLSHDERMTWRRVYIIKWLYDLVNVSSAAQLKKNRESPDPKSLEYVDWTGDHERTIFGLNEFAVDITRMAMQRSNFQVETLIQLHHVFQVQCIVDSFTISRGWYIPIEGAVHAVVEPAVFQTTRDIDVFLDRQKQLQYGGYQNSITGMQMILSSTCEDFPHLQGLVDQILSSGQDFQDYLGQHVYANKKGGKRKIWKGIEPSRFGTADANGLQKYSPYLCGAGLEEALSISYKQMMWLWQVMREPILILHIYKFLKQHRYFPQPVPLWESLAVLFKRGVFRENEDDTTNSGRALRTLLEMQQSLTIPEGENIHESFDITRCRTFNRESALAAYRKVNWNYGQVILDQSSDTDLSILLAMLHREEETQPAGPPKNTDGAESGTVEEAGPSGQMSTTEATTQATGDNGASPKSKPPIPPQPGPDEENEERHQDVIGWAYADFLDDVCGFDLEKPLRPLSGINYSFVTNVILNAFYEIEIRLRQAQNPMYRTYRDRSYAGYHMGSRSTNPHERGTLFLQALDMHRTPEQENRGMTMHPPAKEVLQITAEVLAAVEHTIWDFTYWNAITRVEYERQVAARNAPGQT